MVLEDRRDLRDDDHHEQAHDPRPEHHHDDGVGHGRRDLRRSACCASRKSARRVEHGVEVAGGLARADHVRRRARGRPWGAGPSVSASELPSLTFWRTPVRMTSNLLLSDCSESAPSASASGMPARSSVPSCRVKTATSCGCTLWTSPPRSTSRFQNGTAAPPVVARGRLRGRLRAAAQHLAVLGHEDAVAPQDEAQPLGAVGVARAADGLAAGVEPLPGVDRHRWLPSLHVLRRDHEDLGGRRHPRSTFCAPSSRSVRMPTLMAWFFTVCASAFLIVSCRIFSSMMSSS